MKKSHHLSCFIIVFSIFICSLLSASDVSTDGAKKMRQRLEQLFIWRVTDRLHLNSEEEAKFTSEYKKLSEERASASSKMDGILSKLSEEKSKKVKMKLLGEYEDVFKKYTEIQQDEMTAMKKLFDTDRLADYVLLKRDLRHRFRDVLAKNAEEAPSDKEKAKNSSSSDNK